MHKSKMAAIAILQFFPSFRQETMCNTTFRSIFRIRNSFPTSFFSSEVMLAHKCFVKQRFRQKTPHKYYYISN